jgi:hypothetical protein
MPRPLYPRGIDPVPLVQETEWVYGPILMGVGNPALSGPRYPTILACSESLYGLSYSGPLAVQEIPSFCRTESSSPALPLNLSQLNSLHIVT